MPPENGNTPVCCSLLKQQVQAYFSRKRMYKLIYVCKNKYTYRRICLKYAITRGIFVTEH